MRPGKLQNQETAHLVAAYAGRAIRARCRESPQATLKMGTKQNGPPHVRADHRRHRRRRSPRRAAGPALAAAALGGLAAGLALAFSSPARPDAAAAAAPAAALDLRDAPFFVDRSTSAPVARALDFAPIAAPERLPAATGAPGGRPRIILIVDDVGLDPAAFEALMGLPGPLTLSILPYAPAAQALADRARARGDAVMLHLPMEASGGADPGPGALETGMAREELFRTLRENLDSLSGYVAVNNHMGSKFTRDAQAMKRLLAMLDGRGLAFVDSVTTRHSTAAQAGLSVGARVFARDVFLDADPGREAVRAQIARAEAIARETGHVVAICHPRADTLAMIGAWLTSAPARGFELATIDALTGRPQAFALVPPRSGR